MNNCIFIGRLTDTPSLEDANGVSLCKFSLAVNRKYKSKDKVVDEVSYLDMIAWDKGAESISQWFNKGDAIIVYCSAKQERWKDADNKNRSKIVFRVEKFDFPPKSNSKRQSNDNDSSDADSGPVNSDSGNDSEQIPF